MRTVIASLCLMSLAMGMEQKPSAQEEAVLLENAYEAAGSHAPHLRKVVEGVPADQKKGAIFLISHMPAADLNSLDTTILSKNIDYAYQARQRFPWAKDVPEDVFLNDVLPYAVIDEKREEWRSQFFSLFSKKVEGCKTMEEAIRAVNKDINKTVKVEYNTRREKTNQSPSESMRQNMASCTGLAILLVDAFRSVGIPARFAGTASWHDNRGNHSWVEVWVNGKWLATEFYMPQQLDRPWFLANAGKAKEDDKKYAIFASSYRRTGEAFPLIWAPDSSAVPALNVTRHYVDTCAEMMGKATAAGTHTSVSLRMFKSPQKKTHSEDRVAVNVDVFAGDLQMDGGRTSDPHKDMNDALTFLLEKNKTYTFKYHNAEGKLISFSVELEETPLVIDAYME